MNERGYQNMKKYLTTLILLISLINVYANDTYIEVSSGAMGTVTFEKNPNIQMVSEVIEITFYDDFYETEVHFNFFNHGETEIIQVGFPQWQRGTRGDFSFIDFETTVNNKPVKFQEIDADTILEPRNILINKWYVREIEFIANQDTQTSVKYMNILCTKLEQNLYKNCNLYRC